MNLKKIIREEMDNSLQWIMDIKSYPTLQQLFDKGEIKEGDVLVLRGEVQSDDERGEITWVNDFTITINSEGGTLNTTSFDLDPNEIEAEEAMGLSNHINVTFLKSDGNLEVIRKNNQSTQLTESQEDPFKWMKDIEAGDLWTPYVGMKFIITDGSDDVIYHILNINDEEGWMELKWKDNKSGEEEYFGWYMEDYYRMVEEDRIQIVHDKLNESEKDLDWIKNINPIPLLEVGSCFVDVMDPTQREWTIVSLPMVGESRTKFVRLFTIDEEGEGVYEMIRKDKFQEDVYTGRYKPCQR